MLANCNNYHLCYSHNYKYCPYCGQNLYCYPDPRHNKYTIYQEYKKQKTKKIREGTEWKT